VNDRFEFLLNGEVVQVSGASPNTTLADWLRAQGRTGTKQGCSEGDCGACTVALVERDARGRACYRALTSCIALLPMVAGREVVTVEGLAAGNEPHPVQAALVQHGGSQCGYCTPGFVVSMFEGYYREGGGAPSVVADQLCGNLCRCTGYRPIRDAMLQCASARGERDGSDPFARRLAESVPFPERLDYRAGEQRFLRPTTLEELLDLRAKHPEAVLVAGATEIGVLVTKKAQRFPLLISTEGVAELRSVRRDALGFRVGGAATLTQLEEALEGELPALGKMLRVFASRQIRNRATLAGNLVTASPIGDMAPVLLALDAEVVLASRARERVVALDAFFVSYRKTVLEKDEILKEVVIPTTTPPGIIRKCESFKVSKRRELDIAIVAACYRIDLDAAGIVQEARLAYGGVAAMPARARKTEELLRGRRWTLEAVSHFFPALAQEFNPLTDHRGTADYRRALVVSLFEKFLEGGASEAQDAPLEFAPSAPLATPADPGRSLKHESALGHVTGRAEYVFDEAQKRPMLEVWPVTSPHAHARIRRRDASAARLMPGVVTVLFAEDIPGENDVGVVRKDEVLLADREVLYHGHMVALVVGETIDACRAAAAKVEVDYEPLPAILTLEDAIAASSFHTEPHVIRRGDAGAALEESPRRLSGELVLGGQEHFYLETHAAWAERGDDGDMRVVSSTQHPSEIQTVVASVLHLARNRVVVESPRMGGGFGGKETQGNAWAALVALAAWKTGRPVRVMLDRDIDMELTGKRHPFLARFDVGFDTDGTLRAARVELTSNGGFCLDLSGAICDRALFHLDNAYYVPAVEFSGRVAKTHLASNTAFRGFGGPQGMCVIEEVLGRVARATGLEPEVVRERNLYRGTGESNTTHYGQLVEDNRLQRIWRNLKENSRFDARRAEVDGWNATHPRVKRGLAITPVKFGISFTTSFLNQAGALVIIYADGTVQVNHGGTEMGQGLYTKMQGVAMRELGLPASRVRVMKTSTDKVPNTSATAASASADLNGAAVRNACVTLRERLAPVAARLLEEKLGSGQIHPESVAFRDGKASSLVAPGIAIDFQAVVERAYLFQVSLSATGFYRTPGISYDRARGRGKPFHYFACGAAVSEVEVDGWTGMKRLRRVDILHDVGDSLNPGVDRGQIEGGFVQGVGWLTGEELLWDAKGRLLTHSASTYQIPAISDAPAEFHVALLPDAGIATTIHGSKAVGEPPLMLALSVREALKDAVGAFGPDGGAVELASPATHEAIYFAIRRRFETRKDAPATLAVTGS
jgi:xanthine dehydrogenase molybdopterin binding subunit/xanthine dehydrogenase small subunit